MVEFVSFFIPSPRAVSHLAVVILILTHTHTHLPIYSQNRTSTLPRKSELTAATADREDSQQGSRNLDRAQSQKSGDDGAARSASRRISSTISNLFQSFRSRKSVSLRADGDSKGPSSRTLGEGDDAPNALNKGLGARQAGAAFVQATSSMRKLPLVGEGNGGTADAEDRGQGGASTSYPKEESERNVQSGRTRRKSSGVAKQKASIAAVECVFPLSFFPCCSSFVVVLPPICPNQQPQPQTLQFQHVFLFP